MSALVKGMEMPTSCPCELLGIGYDLYCSFAVGIPARVREYYECCKNGTRPSWCPLVPVPPHGRLIDADDFIKRINELVRQAHTDGFDLGAAWYTVFIRHIELAPTIIPAEEGET